MSQVNGSPDITKVGGLDVPIVGVQPVLPTVVYDSDGNIVGGDNPLTVKKQPLDLLLATDSSDSNLQYIGYAEIGSLTGGAVWQIFRIDGTTGTKKGWADSNANFDNIWDDRESLTYSQ